MTIGEVRSAPLVSSLGCLALAHCDLGDWAGAESFTRRAEEQLTGIEQAPERIPVVVARATISAHNGDQQAGAAAIAEALAMMPTTAATPCLRAEATLRATGAAHSRGDDESAILLA